MMNRDNTRPGRVSGSKTVVHLASLSTSVVMRAAMFFIGLSVALVVSSGCASVPPQRTGTTVSRSTTNQAAPSREQVIRDAHRRFPDAAYIVGFGFGDEAEEAEERARIDAASRIRSEIDANIEVVEHGDASGAQSSEVHSRIIEKVQTEAGALIRPMRELTRRASDGRMVAVAVIARDELDREYEAQSTPLLERLIRAWSRALESEEMTPNSAALCEADAVEQELNDKDLERRLVTGRSAWTEEALALRQRVFELRERIKGSTEVQVVRVAAPAGRELSDILLQSLERQGYSARVVDSPVCDREAVVLNVAVEESCGDAPIGGVRCEVRIDTRADRCHRSGALFEVMSESGRALHASNEALALRQAAGRIDVGGYASTLADRLVASMGGSCGR